MASRRQANFLLSEEVMQELRRSVKKREQSHFVEAALQKELKRLKLERALEGSFGAWRDKDHPELGAGTERFVRKLRRTMRGSGALDEKHSH
jgi:hypothetical protein